MQNSFDEFIRFVFFNVQHGFCCLISLPPEHLGEHRRYGVIDCHRSGASCFVESYLRKPPFPDEPPIDTDNLPLEFVVLTHFHRDHFKGIAYLLGGFDSPFRVRRFLGPPSDPRAYAKKKFMNARRDFEELCAIADLAYYPTRRARRAGKSPEFDVFLHAVQYPWFPGVELRALAPLADNVIRNDKLALGNNTSGAIMLRFESRHTAILGGDVSDRDWKEILRKLEERPDINLKASIVGVPHHAGTGNSHDIWNEFSRWRPSTSDERRAPTVAIVSCAYRDHVPQKEICSRIKDLDCTLYCTNACSADKNDNPCRLRTEDFTPFPDWMMGSMSNLRRDSRRTGVGGLERFREQPRNPLDGAIFVEFRVGKPPLVRQLAA